MGLLREILNGERGIRTPGALQLNGFQDRRDRPLCHLSFLKFLQICHFISFYQVNSIYLSAFFNLLFISGTLITEADKLIDSADVMPAEYASEKTEKKFKK